MAAEQRAEQSRARRRVERGADLVATTRASGRACPTSVADGHAELHVAVVADHPAEPGHGRGRGPGTSGELGDRHPSRAAGSARSRSAIFVIAGDGGRWARTRPTARSTFLGVPSTISESFYHFSPHRAKDFLPPASWLRFLAVASYLAVDVGGTSTRAVVVDERGQCRGYGAAGRATPRRRAAVDGCGRRSRKP